MEEDHFVPVEFGRYHLVEKLAKGGMAEIFMAKSRGAHGFEKTLVVKRILPQLASDPEFVEMFIDEAKVMVKINHPKVVQVLDFGEVDNQYFIAMEYVEGVDGLALLRMCVRRGVRPTTYIAVHVVAEVLDALHYAHTLRDDKGMHLAIVHRDISPSNIFISDQGEVKLGDFGIARAAVRTKTAESRNLKGKYGYLAPEVVSGQDVDQRSDIFSAGVVLAELLMVRRLFVAKSDLEVLLQVRDARLDRLDRYGKHIPDDLRTILESALARDPDLRYQDAGTFRDALHRYLYDHRRMVRHTDVRRFLRRLKGEAETDEHEIFTSIPSVAGMNKQDSPTPVGKKVEAMERNAETAEQEASLREALELEQGSVSSSLTPAVEVDPQSGEIKTGSGEQAVAEPPSPRSMMKTPPAELSKPAGSTEYSSSNLRERIHIKPKDSAGKRARQAAAAADSSGESAPAAGGGEDVSISVSGELSFSTKKAPTIGRKRKISVGPPPPPEPVPSSSLPTSDEDSLSLEGVLDLLQESDQMGSDSGWDRSYQDRKLEPVMMPGPGPHKDSDREKVAAAQVQTRGTHSSDGTPDREGDLSDKTPISIIFDLALAEETGMLAFHVGGTVKEIYFVDGAPQSVASNRPEELFGQYLVVKGAISEGELAMALAMLGHFNGKLGDALVALKLLRPVQVIRHLTQQVREKLMETVTWEEGTFVFFRGRVSEDVGAPVGLDSYEILGAAAGELPREYVDRHLAGVGDMKLVSASAPPVPPEVFRRGDLARRVFDQLDGRYTVDDSLSRFDDREQALAFARVIVLFMETGLIMRP